MTNSDEYNHGIFYVKNLQIEFKLTSASLYVIYKENDKTYTIFTCPLHTYRHIFFVF